MDYIMTFQNDICTGNTVFEGTATGDDPRSWCFRGRLQGAVYPLLDEENAVMFAMKKGDFTNNQWIGWRENLNRKP